MTNLALRVFAAKNNNNYMHYLSTLKALQSIINIKRINCLSYRILPVPVDEDDQDDNQGLPLWSQRSDTLFQTLHTFSLL